MKQWFDKWIVDGAVNGSGWIVRQSGNIGRFLQTGRVQSYTFFALLLVVLVSLFKLEVGPQEREVGWPVLTILLAVGIIFLAILSRTIGRQPAGQETKQEEHV